MSSSPITLRHARSKDVPAILSLIHALAEYEREPSSTVMATNESLLKTLGFSGGSPAYAKVLLAFETKGSKGMEDDEGDGGKQEPLGMAIYFTTYSTWRAAPGIHLEDLFVREQHRGRGIGTALLAALAQEVGKIGGARLEWNVLKWNEPSIRFYQNIGAVNLAKEWDVMRVTDGALEALQKRGSNVEWDD